VAALTEASDQEDRVSRARGCLPRVCCGGCLGLPVIALLLAVLWPSGCERIDMATWNVDHIPFDAARWKEPVDAKIESECVRGRMVRDLLADRKLDGLTRGEVEEMLGRPEYLGSGLDLSMDEAEDPAAAMANARVWNYYLGFCSGFQIDPDFLAIEFDEDGLVQNYHTRPT
jgi:hypothetical protein